MSPDLIESGTSQLAQASGEFPIFGAFAPSGSVTRDPLDWSCPIQTICRCPFVFTDHGIIRVSWLSITIRFHSGRDPQETRQFQDCR